MCCIATHGRIKTKVLLVGICEETAFGYTWFFIRNFLDRLRKTPKVSVSLDGQWKEIQKQMSLKQICSGTGHKLFRGGVQSMTIV